MITIETLQAGIEQVNQAYIERPELDGDYPAMVVQYLISSLLIALGGKAGDFGFYTDPQVGYTGYLKIGNEVLFFAPTKAVVLDKPEPAEDNGELSPYGAIP